MALSTSRILRIYQDYRNAPRVTVWFLVRRNYKIYLALFAYVAVCGLVLAKLTNVDIWSYLAVGLAGCLARDVGYFRRSAQIWPTLRQIIDWNKVDEMAEANTASSAPKRPA
jgi:hypothetical protein